MALTVISNTDPVDKKKLKKETISYLKGKKRAGVEGASSEDQKAFKKVMKGAIKQVRRS